MLWSVIGCKKLLEIRQKAGLFYFDMLYVMFEAMEAEENAIFA